MKKVIILAVALVSLFLARDNLYAQPLSEWETKIFYDLLDKESLLPEEASDEEIDRIPQEIADKYGITLGRVRNIVLRAWEEEKLSEREVANELNKNMNYLPQDATENDREIVYREIANKYGIPVSAVKFIEFKYEEW